MRKKIVAGNWKMNMTPAQSVELINTLKDKINTTDVDVVVCPPFVCLPAVLEAVKGTAIAVGAQNMHFEEKGAFTGEIAPSMLVELGVKYVVIGHSERRQYFAETNETVNKKVLKAIEHNLVPIICVGESLAEREQGVTIDLVRLQTKIALKDVKAEDAKKVVIAYEPIWAIGTNETPTTNEIDIYTRYIKQIVKKHFNFKNIKVVYGGSVNEKNIDEIAKIKSIDGVLVGGASTKYKEFIKIVTTVLEEDKNLQNSTN